ncbi:hypothetical protein KC318_g6343 [Hortaea werneckii]|uniref:Uncharacterized protein n=1 Tax=Hortaea werneckii TaxID=91943 RepID=A0A3M7AKC8_HORWE|nr:hypothetical protein KC334_g6805 [Hortaea werneckii]KAI7666704.1 hypothetical protein KC318_g6343 [Hortaea werneckii]RMY07259.1 hypothetical protein D0867_09409 [Hortaea werneckii]RMY27730.1 hypothetical protein D0866_09940 [Hortaea werneckii]
MEDTSSSPPPMVSRYRSQRKAKQHAEETEPVPELPQGGADEGIARSRSRYHRKNQPEGGIGSARPTTAEPHTESPSRSSPARYASRKGRQRHDSPAAQPGATDTPLREDGYGQPAAKPEQAQLNGRSVKHSQSPPPATSSHPETLAQTPSGELFPPMRAEPVQAPPQRIRSDGPPQSSQIKATKSVSELPLYDDIDDDRGGCFGLFKRKRNQTVPASEKTPIARPSQVNKGPRTIKAGGGGVVPATDIPESAVNASDRHVTVRFDGHERSFPVTPLTTPVDIIKSAATVFSSPMNVKSVVLLEYFRTVGVQRPLRRYERIRDVLNSWDNDRENSLLLVDPGTGTSEVELSLAGVPSAKPEEQQSWSLTYSQKPGKWEKRYIVLHPSGQLTQQKDPDKPQSQENIAHLSDFDIYTPTQTKLKKAIKPPKRYCFAVKSQQKSMMFESDLNFVHFFCTGDQATSDAFYSALQEWRSWYLVNVMGEGGKAQPRPTGTVNTGGPRAVRDFGDRELPTTAHHTGDSFDSHYQLGSYKPLIDQDGFENKRPQTSRSSHENTAPPPQPPSSGAKGGSGLGRTSSSAAKKHAALPKALGKEQLADNEPLGNLARHRSTDRRRNSSDGHGRGGGGSDDFAKDGLLGRSYTQRQQKQTAAGERDRLNAAKPFTSGATLLGRSNSHQNDGPRPSSQDGGGGGLHRNPSSARSGAKPVQQSNELRRNVSRRNGGGGGIGGEPTTDLHRSGSSRQRIAPANSNIPAGGPVGGSIPGMVLVDKPLVDLTPETYEPPQHSLKGKGKGFRPERIGPGGLIDSATSPEDVVGVPPSMEWRGGSGGGGRGIVGNGISSGTGAGAKGGSGGSGGGGPMLDLSEESKFAPGSLLNRVEREQGREAGPVIDREKRVERFERVGEGY